MPSTIYVDAGMNESFITNVSDSKILTNNFKGNISNLAKHVVDESIKKEVNFLYVDSSGLGQALIEELYSEFKNLGYVYSNVKGTFVKIEKDEMENNLKILHEVVDVEIYDMDSNLIVELKSLKEAELIYYANNSLYATLFRVKDVLLNKKMLELLSEQEIIEKEIDFSFNNSHRRLKLICKGFLTDPDNNRKERFTITIPKAILRKEHTFNFGKSYHPEYIFEIEEGFKLDFDK